MSSSSSSASAKLNVLILGSTGATGKPLLAQLEKCDRVNEITALVRRLPPTAVICHTDLEEPPRVKYVAVDFDSLLTDKADNAEFRQKDVVFCCLGTTRKDAGSAEAFVKVDHDYVLAAAKLAHSARVPHFSIVTAAGSNADSWFLYMQTKGKVENALKALNFSHLSIFQPGLLLRPDNTRFGEKLATWFMPALPTSTLATAMLQDALNQARPGGEAPSHGRHDVEVFGNNAIKQLAAAAATTAAAAPAAASSASSSTTTK